MMDPPLMERLATGTNDAGPLPPPRPAHGPAETVATGGNAGPSNVLLHQDQPILDHQLKFKQ